MGTAGEGATTAHAEGRGRITLLPGKVEHGEEVTIHEEEKERLGPKRVPRAWPPAKGQLPRQMADEWSSLMQQRFSVMVPLTLLEEVIP